MRGSRLAVSLAVALLVPAAAFAQGGGIGIGPRITFVRGSEAVPDSSQRFFGGKLRLGGGHSAIEVAIDYRSGVTGSLTERVKSYPIQGSLLLYPVRARIAPYLLGGIGWYSQQVTRFEAPTGRVIVDEVTTRKMGYHVGFGGEVRAHRRLGLYGDYRYTMLGFGDDEDGAQVLPGFVPGADRLRLSHEGSMFTWGAIFYF
jgi:hypothetical protein